MSFQFRVYVDWDNNGNFTGTYDDITDDVMSVTWQLGFREPYQPIADEPTATIRLHNQSGKYNPELSSSPLSGNVRAYRPVKIIADDGLDRDMWTGMIDMGGIKIDWSTHPQTATRTATLTCVGYKQTLERLRVPIQYYTSVTGDTIIGAILSEAGITNTDLQTGITVLDSYGDQSTSNAFDMIREITDAERGRFFVARDGAATWWNRHYLLTKTTYVSVVYTSTGDYKPVDIDYVYSEYLANVVTVDVMPRRTYSSETVWELDTTITVQSGQKTTIRPQLRRSNGQFTGSGSLTPTPTFSSGYAVITVTPRGGMAEVTIDNSSGSIPAVLTGLTLVGTPTQTQNQVTVVREDAASIAAYGPHEYRTSLPIGDIDHAETIAEFELNRRKDPRGFIKSITYRRKLDGNDNAHMYLTWGIDTRIRIAAAELGLSTAQDYFIIGEHHTWDASQNVQETRFYLEPAGLYDYWILGTSKLGETTRLAP